jgi:hypothetical protein
MHHVSPPPPQKWYELQQWATERPSMQGRSSEFLLLLTDHHPPITDRIIGASSLPLLLATTLWMDANYQCASSFKKNIVWYVVVYNC